MKNVKSFILGMATAIVVIPLAENLTELLCSYLEPLKIENTKRILKGNKEITELQMQLEDYHDDNVAIGFQVDSSEEEFDDEEWEDKTKNKIGF